MFLTILIMIVGIALFICSGILMKNDGKKSTLANIAINKSIKILAIILVAGSVCRMYMPYYLTKVNPAILQEMATAMQEQQTAEKNKQLRSYIHEHLDEMIADAPVWGKEDAKNTIFLWSDYSCPYCRRVHNELAKVMDERDDVRVVLKNFSIHGALSDAPAKAVIAAKLQGTDKAAALDQKLMSKEYYSQDDLKDQDHVADKIKANVMALAAEVGLDTARLEKDMEGEVVAREFRNVRELAQRFEINGTPYLLINEKSFPGAIPYDQIIDALNK